MASSEISSSEINQSQGQYHDGKNEASGLPPLSSPLAPSQVNIEPEPGFWKRYSSHYEFPLSLVIAIGIHVIAVLLVVAFMTLNLYWSQPQPPPIEHVTIQNEGNNNQPGPSGGHTGDEGNNTPKLEDPTFTPLELSKTTEKLTVPDVSTDPSSLIPAPLSAEQNSNPKTGLPGPLGRGQGKTKGDGMGDGEGGGPMARNKRWQILFTYDDPEVLLSQFSQLKLTVAARSNNGRYMVYQPAGLTAPFRSEEMNDTALIKLVNDNKYLWFRSIDRTTCENFAIGVNSAEHYIMLVLLVPGDLEQAILQAELAHHQLNEEQIRQRKLHTSFRITRTGTAWKVQVVKSEVMNEKSK